MLRRALITAIASVVLVSLFAVAQDTSGNQAQNSSANEKAANTAQPEHSSAKKKKKKKNKKKKNKKVQNPIANVDSKQPDKVLFDRAMDAMKHAKYDVARLSLQTLINTYPDSEYVARAKLAIGDSWYDEGGAAAFAQAESEYKDFITFFPNMPEAAEAQMKIANIHFREMEKADRDPTHALRAEEEYRQMILQFPDSPLIPQAKDRLLEVQEVLAEREYMIGHFYYLRDTYIAAIARLKSVADTYPLYSGADEALFELGSAYEKQSDFIRRSKLPEAAKGRLIKEYGQNAVAAYDRILMRYPLEDRAGDAKKRLQALKQPVPKATPQAIAQNKAEIASRGSLGKVGKVMENFSHTPDVSEADKVGEPSLVDPKQTSAPDIVRAVEASIRATAAGGQGNNQVSVERVDEGAAPPANAPIPRSDAEPGATTSSDNAATNASDNNATTGGAGNPAPVDNSAGTEMGNDLAPAANNGSAPLPPPTQINDLANSGSSHSSSAAASSSSAQQQAPPIDPSKESSSKKKKKHRLIPF
jgi:outer membrane protein assembly factor BamD